MRLLNTTGILLQIVAMVVSSAGVFYALFYPSYLEAYNRASSYLSGTASPNINYGTLSADLLIGGLLGGLVLLALGGMCRGVAQSAEANLRTAVALEALVQRRTGVGTLPKDAAKRLKQTPTPAPRESL